MNFKDINPDLCNFCGACIAVCPRNCLSAGREKVVFDESRCIDCGLCYNSCQGVEFDFSKARNTFKRKRFHEIIGGYDSIHIGKSKNQELLEQSSSGGLVPEFLIYALEMGVVDGVIMVLKSKSNPLGYKIAVAKTKKQVLGRCQSLYRLIPVNMILNRLGEEKNLAFVGLPCQVEALRKLQMNGNPEAKKIKLVVGLFCGLNQSFKSVEFILKKLKVRREDITGFSQRKKDFKKGKGWPGGFYIRTKDNKEFFLGKEMYEYLYYKYASPRCLLCYDYTNEFADISFGDAWSKQPSKEGWSEIVVRNELSKKILRGLKKEDRIILEESSLSSLMSSHPGHITLKKKGIFLRMKKAKAKPNYNVQEKRFGKKVEFSQMMTFLFIKFIRSNLMDKVLNWLPLGFIGRLTYSLKRILRFLLFKKKQY